MSDQGGRSKKLRQKGIFLKRMKDTEKKQQSRSTNREARKTRNMKQHRKIQTRAYTTLRDRPFEKFGKLFLLGIEAKKFLEKLS